MFCRCAGCSSVAVGFVFLQGMMGKKDTENQKRPSEIGFQTAFLIA